MSAPSDPSDLPSLLAALAQEFPGAHAYSLLVRSLLVLTGAEVARVLRNVKAGSIPV